MSQHYLFHEAGSIPGIPGTFSNCRVDVTEEGGLLIGPLDSTAFVPTVTSISEEDVPDAPVEASTDASQPQEEAEAPAVVQEQEAPQLALNIN